MIREMSVKDVKEDLSHEFTRIENEIGEIISASYSAEKCLYRVLVRVKPKANLASKVGETFVGVEVNELARLKAIDRAHGNLLGYVLSRASQESKAQVALDLYEKEKAER